jgi:PAS domain S-box-containing protein
MTANIEDKFFKILLLEDSKEDAELISHIIKKAGLDFIIKRVDTKEEFINGIATFNPDIILSDHSLPQFNSTEALKICRMQSSSIPFILVTGTVSEEFAVSIMNAGADDYLIKGNLNRLPFAILAAIKKKQNELEKKLAVESLKKSEEYFRGLIENSSDIFALIDYKKNIQYLSPSIKRILGYNTSELKNKNIEQFIYPEDISSLNKIIEGIDSNLNMDLVFTEFRFIHKNKAWRSLECISKVDKIKGFIILNIRDITERKLTEQYLKLKNNELEKINGELDSFVYSASHDLRAPLKSILGLVNLSKMDYKRNEYHSLLEYAGLIENSILKLDETIQKIINYSGNARTQIVLEEINLEKIIEDIFEKLKYIPNCLKIKKIVSIEANCPFISDVSRIIIIFNNLISNSIKYSNPNRTDSYIKIDVRINLEEAVIIFEDNGIGINEKYIDKIFNMFYRATEKSDGSGLGLYIVKEIISRLEASINVTSILDKGTTFLIRIPNNK